MRSDHSSIARRYDHYPEQRPPANIAQVLIGLAAFAVVAVLVVVAMMQ